MAKQKEILRQTGVYFSGTALTQAITLIATLISRRFLGPLQTGIWSALQIFVDYSKYSTLGVMEALGRDIPYWIGKGDQERADEIKNSAFSFVMTSSAIVAGATAIFALLTRGKTRPEVTYGLFLVAAIIILQRVNNFLICVLRAHKQFSVETGQMIVSSLVNAVLVASLTYYFKIYGFIFALLFSFVFNIVYLLFQYRFHFRWQLQLGKIFPLIQFGFPLMLLGLITTVLRSLDKIMIAKWMGFQALGFYSIALMVCSYTSNFSIAVNTVLFPYFQEKFSTQDDPRDLKKYLIGSSHGYAVLMPGIIGLAWIGVPYLIQWFLPKFIPGIEAMRILVFSMLFIALIQPYHDFLITIKKHFVLFPFLAVIAVLAFGFNYAAIYFHYGLTGVAWVTTAMAFVQFSGTYFLAANHLDDGRAMTWNYLVLLGAIFYLILTCWLIQLWIPGDVLSLSQTLFQAVIFTLFWSPCLIWFVKEKKALFLKK